MESFQPLSVCDASWLRRDEWLRLVLTYLLVEQLFEDCLLRSVVRFLDRFIPLPNRPGLGGILPNANYQSLAPQQTATDQFIGRVDHIFRVQDRVYGRYAISDTATIGPPVWPTFGYSHNLRGQHAVLNYSHTFGAATINEFRAGYNRRHETKLPFTQDQDWARQLGMPNVAPDTFPRFNTGYNGTPGGTFSNIAEDNTFQDNLTKVAGRHTMKFGYELVKTRYNALVEALPSGAYSFGGTELPFTANTGNIFASFLLGNVSSAQFTRAQATWLPRWTSHSWYVQDDFRPMRNLTLNLGLRWSYESPYHTKYGQQSQFDPTVNDPITGRLGAIVHKPGELAKKDLNNFQPRLGLAWNFRPKWVFRSSFSLVTIDLLTNGINQNFEEYLATANVQAPTGDPRTVFKLSQGPPAAKFSTSADGSSPYVGTNFAQRNATWYDPNMRSPYIMNWSGGLQYQFKPAWLLDLIYQGSAGVKLLNTWNTNVLPIGAFPGPADPARTETMRQNFQSFKPYTQFGNVDLVSNFGHNTYHGATARVEKRYSGGMTLNTFYTWSKTLNNADDDGSACGKGAPALTSTMGNIRARITTSITAGCRPSPTNSPPARAAGG